MSDLHDKISADVERRLAIARAATPWGVQSVHVYMDGSAQVRIAAAGRPALFPMSVLGGADAQYFRDHDPADAIRRYEYALKVLGMHQWRAPGVNCGCDKGMCSCGEHVPWPCDELIWLATSLGIEVSS